MFTRGCKGNGCVIEFERRQSEAINLRTLDNTNMFIVAAVGRWSIFWRKSEATRSVIWTELAETLRFLCRPRFFLSREVVSNNPQSHRFTKQPASGPCLFVQECCFLSLAPAGSLLFFLTKPPCSPSVFFPFHFIGDFRGCKNKEK